MSIKVLVADDSITIQKVIGIIFGGDEYSLTVVDNGKAAIEKAREINPDILLIDALMPGMTGYEVSEVVRATPSLADKPILILTGSFEPFDEEKAKKCGADDFIAKPFESQQIITKVQELLELGKNRAQSTLASQAQTEISAEQPPIATAPTFDVSAQVAFVQPEAPKSADPADIWGAFTPEDAPFAEVTEVPVTEDLSASSFDPDVFAIVSEEEDVQFTKPAPVTTPSFQSTGTQWLPVEESTFEFEEETGSGIATTVVEQSITIQEPSIDDISFEDETEFQTVQTPPEADYTSAPAPESADFTVPPSMYEEPPVLEPVAAAMVASTETPPAPLSLTEEQLKAAISSASKEVIERIVWEVVPDLAEALIRDAIRKIKEGI